MSKTDLVHDVSVWSPYAQETHTARCTCEWSGPLRASLTAAQIDAKEHRLDTAVADDSNKKRRNAKAAKDIDRIEIDLMKEDIAAVAASTAKGRRVRKGTLREVAEGGSE